jgi:hypothetical protein
MEPKAVSPTRQFLNTFKIVYDFAIWRSFYTFMHCLFSAVWIYATVTYGPALRSLWKG